jgi:hypothetical protein
MQFTLSAAVVSAIMLYVIPIVTSLLTKFNASTVVKQIVTAVLSVLVSIITMATQVDGTAIVSWQVVLLSLLEFLGSSAAYRVVYKPHALNARVAPNVGIGGSPTTAPSV